MIMKQEETVSSPRCPNKRPTAGPSLRGDRCPSNPNEVQFNGRTQVLSCYLRAQFSIYSDYRMPCYLGQTGQVLGVQESRKEYFYLARSKGEEHEKIKWHCEQIHCNAT